MAQFSGTLNDDVISGTLDADIIDAKDGNDVVDAGDGNDVITGGIGDDTLTGGTGDDTFVFTLTSGPLGSTGATTYYTSFGNDRIVDFSAGAGSDDKIDLSGLVAHPSYDLTFDYLMANTEDVDGNAVITLARNGGVSTITLEGVSKSDLHEDDFIGPELQNPYKLEGTAGDDTLTATVSGATLRGYDGDDILNGGSGRANLYGGSGDDTLTGGAMGGVIHGEGGDDIITGSDMSDMISGGDGNDDIRTGNGLDIASGGAGSDSLIGGNGHRSPVWRRR